MRILFFAIIAILSVVIGQWAFKPEQAVQFILFGGYWIHLVVMLLFFYWLYQCVAPHLKKPKYWTKSFWLGKKNILTILLLLACFGYIRVQEETEFKVLMDEAVLVATCMSMSEDRLVRVPNRAHTIAGTLHILDGFVDKRPATYPFLLSVIHDATGYRVENAFYFNIFVTALFVFLVYLFGYRLAGRSGGIMSVLLFTFLPLLVRTANGGGFELFNLCMMLLAMLLSIEYLSNPSKTNLSALCLTGVVLAQMRYESVMYIAPVGLVILLGWCFSKKVTIPWALMITPILLIPYLWHHKVFDLNEGHWQLWDRSEATSPFGFQYVYKNLGHAMNFFFSTSGEMTNSLVIPVLGLIFIPFFLVALYKLLKCSSELFTPILVLSIFLVGFGMNALLLLTYFFGQLDDPIIHRLSLPLHIPMVFIPVWMIYAYVQSFTFRRISSWVICLGIAVFCVPRISAKHYSQNYLPTDRVNWSRDVIKNSELAGKHYFVLTESPFFWIMHKVDALSTAFAEHRKEKLLYYLSQKGNPPVFVEQNRLLNAPTGTYSYDGGFLKADKKYDIDNDFVLEPYKETYLWPLRMIRLYRLVDIKNTELPDLPIPKNNKEYMIQWAENLP